MGKTKAKRKAGKKWVGRVLVAVIAAVVIALLVVLGLRACSGHDGFDENGATGSVGQSASNPAPNDVKLNYRPSDEEHIVRDEVTGSGYIDNELVVTVDENVSPADVQDAIAAYEGEIIGANEYLHTYQVLLPEKHGHDDLLAMASELEQAIPSAEAMPNYYIELNLEYYPNDDKWAGEWDEAPGGKNWGAEAIHAPQVWDYCIASGSPSINVGVLDNQFYTEHEDISFSDTYLNDFNPSHLNDFDRSENNPEARKYSNHGTHVAGTIAATFDNGKGIAGIAPKVNLFGASYNGLGDRPVKEDAQGLSVTEYEAGFVYLIALSECRVVNLSYGGGMPEDKNPEDVFAEVAYMSHMQNCLRSLIDDGYDFLISKAAGNDRMDYGDYDVFSLLDDPVVLEHVITVGAAKIGDDGEKHVAEYSNYGSAVDLIAPGSDIYSSVCSDKSPFSGLSWSWGWLFSDYGYMSGTSMAAPHVAGVAAAIWSVNPQLSGPEIKQAICSTASGEYGYEDGLPYKYPMLDSAAAMEAASAMRGPAVNNAEDDAQEPVSSTASSFAIEGSWKSIGSVGFGQAQPGITVTFDGSQCDFYSPADTYRLYESGGALKLDCTNMLWKDTLTFDVEVVDNDHITIYTGSPNTTTQLERLPGGGASSGDLQYIDGLYANFDLPLILVYDFYDDGVVYASWVDDDGNFLTESEGEYSISDGMLRMSVDMDAAAESVGLDAGINLGKWTSVAVPVEIEGDFLYIGGMEFERIE